MYRNGSADGHGVYRYGAIHGKNLDAGFGSLTERFSESSNQYLACSACPEKLCHHKKQLQRFLRRNREYLRLKGNSLFNREE